VEKRVGTRRLVRHRDSIFIFRRERLAMCIVSLLIVRLTYVNFPTHEHRGIASKTRQSIMFERFPSKLTSWSCI